MTVEERNIKLKHLITCYKCEASGKACDEDCPTQYEAGTIGEVIENLEEISKILDQQPCKDAVNRQAVLDVLKKHWLSGTVAHRVIDEIGLSINALPSVTPKEKTGKWEYVQYDGNPNIGNLHCSECERIAGMEYKYCPNCGARMVSE